jgi:hypothetical protein
MKSESNNLLSLRFTNVLLDIISRMQPYCDNMIAFKSVSSRIQSIKPLFTSKAVFSGFFCFLFGRDTTNLRQWRIGDYFSYHGTIQKLSCVTKGSAESIDAGRQYKEDPNLKHSVLISGSERKDGSIEQNFQKVSTTDVKIRGNLLSPYSRNHQEQSLNN